MAINQTHTTAAAKGASVVGAFIVGGRAKLQQSTTMFVQTAHFDGILTDTAVA